MSRKEKAQVLLDQNKFQSLGSGWYLFESQKDTGIVYEINVKTNYCDCPDHQNRKVDCKHLLAAKAFEQQAAKPAEQLATQVSVLNNDLSPAQE